MANVHGSPGDAPQMPAAAGPGPAPAPYQGADQDAGDMDYVQPQMPLTDVAADIMAGYPGATIATEAPWAHDPAAGPPDAPYYQGPHVPVDAAGDNDAGGRDDVASTVAAAVANAQARWHEFQSDTYGQGSVIGDLIHFPPSPLDPGVGVGNTDPSGGFFDPPRGYGGTKGAPNYGGTQGGPGEQGAAQ